MDQLIESLATGFAVTTTPCSSLPGRLDLFKKKPSHQELRRHEFLSRQKDKRYDAIQHARCLAHGFVRGERSEESMETTDEEDGRRPSRPPRSYSDQLMQSEWMVDVPDLSKYLVKPCPFGKRALLVASHGKTKLYARNGNQFLTFVSNLPGGSVNSGRQLNWRSNEFTILDVIYNDRLKTCYILDLIAWRSKHYYDSDTTFRFYWLQTQFSENAEQIASTTRRIKLEIVPHFAWNETELQKLLSAETLPFQAKLDGILFYHQDTHYNPGGCPLVGWLKAYMVPEVLGINVHPKYLEEMPSDYSSLRNKVAEEERRRSGQASA